MNFSMNLRSKSKKDIHNVKNHSTLQERGYWIFWKDFDFAYLSLSKSLGSRARLEAGNALEKKTFAAAQSLGFVNFLACNFAGTFWVSGSSLTVEMSKKSLWQCFRLLHGKSTKCLHLEERKFRWFSSLSHFSTNRFVRMNPRPNPKAASFWASWQYPV